MKKINIRVVDSVKDRDAIRLYDQAYKLRNEWCTCGKDEFLFYAEDNNCACGCGKHHVHCKCGAILQVG